MLLKTYNQSNIQKLGMCTVQLRQNCQMWISVMLGDISTLLQMSDIRFVDIWKIIGEGCGRPTSRQEFDSQS